MKVENVVAAGVFGCAAFLHHVMRNNQQHARGRQQRISSATSTSTSGNNNLSSNNNNVCDLNGESGAPSTAHLISQTAVKGNKRAEGTVQGLHAISLEDNPDLVKCDDFRSNYDKQNKQSKKSNSGEDFVGGEGESYEECEKIKLEKRTFIPPPDDSLIEIEVDIPYGPNNEARTRVIDRLQSHSLHSPPHSPDSSSSGSSSPDSSSSEKEITESEAKENLREKLKEQLGFDVHEFELRNAGTIRYLRFASVADRVSQFQIDTHYITTAPNLPLHFYSTATTTKSSSNSGNNGNNVASSVRAALRESMADFKKIAGSLFTPGAERWLAKYIPATDIKFAIETAVIRYLLLLQSQQILMAPAEPALYDNAGNHGGNIDYDFDVLISRDAKSLLIVYNPLILSPSTSSDSTGSFQQHGQLSSQSLVDALKRAINEAIEWTFKGLLPSETPVDPRWIFGQPITPAFIQSLSTKLIDDIPTNNHQHLSQFSRHERFFFPQKTNRAIVDVKRLGLTQAMEEDLIRSYGEREYYADLYMLVKMYGIDECRLFIPTLNPAEIYFLAHSIREMQTNSKGNSNNSGSSSRNKLLLFVNTSMATIIHFTFMLIPSILKQEHWALEKSKHQKLQVNDHFSLFSFSSDLQIVRSLIQSHNPSPNTHQNNPNQSGAGAGDAIQTDFHLYLATASPKRTREDTSLPSKFSRIKSLTSSSSSSSLRNQISSFKSLIQLAPDKLEIILKSISKRRPITSTSSSTKGKGISRGIRRGGLFERVIEGGHLFLCTGFVVGTCQKFSDAYAQIMGKITAEMTLLRRDMDRMRLERIHGEDFDVLNDGNASSEYKTDNNEGEGMGERSNRLDQFLKGSNMDGQEIRVAKLIIEKLDSQDSIFFASFEKKWWQFWKSSAFGSRFQPEYDWLSGLIMLERKMAWMFKSRKWILGRVVEHLVMLQLDNPSFTYEAARLLDTVDCDRVWLNAMARKLIKFLSSKF